MIGKEALDNIAVYSATHNHLLDSSVEAISKELKAFEIMKNKMVNVYVLMQSISDWDKDDEAYVGLECYNAAISGRASALVPRGSCDLTEYEYDLLKEVLVK